MYQDIISVEVSEKSGIVYLAASSASGCEYKIDFSMSKEDIAHQCAVHFENYLLNELYGDDMR